MWVQIGIIVNCQIIHVGVANNPDLICVWFVCLFSFNTILLVELSSWCLQGRLAVSQVNSPVLLPGLSRPKSGKHP